MAPCAPPPPPRAAAGDFAGFMGHVRTLSPAALDRELRGMMVLGGDDPEDAQQQREVADVGLLLEALLLELDAARNFELVQALTSRVLTVGFGGGGWGGA